jgi:hypothetical protein
MVFGRNLGPSCVSARPRSLNANSLWWLVLAEPAGVITTFQIHGPRTDDGRTMATVPILSPTRTAHRSSTKDVLRLSADGGRGWGRRGPRSARHWIMRSAQAPGCAAGRVSPVNTLIHSIAVFG